MSDMEAQERLVNEAAPQGMLGFGVVRSYNDDDARSWPDGLEVASTPPRRADGQYPAETLLAVGRLLNAEAHPEVIGEVAARAATLLTGARDVAVYHVELGGDRLTILARHNDDTERIDDTPLPESLHVSTDRRPTLIELGSVRAERRAGDTRRAIYVPLRAGGRAVGAILIVDWSQHGEDIEPTLEDLEALAHVVAGPLALAVFPAVQQVGPAYPLEALQRTAEAVARQAELEGVLRTIGDGLRSHVPHQIIAAFRSDNLARTLQRVFIDVTDPDIHVNGLADLKFGEAMTGRVALSGSPLLLNNAHRDRRVPLTQVERKGSQVAFQRLHLIAIPLLAGGNLLGVVTLLRLDDAGFTTDEFTFAQLFVGLATSAMQDAKRALMQQERYLGGLRALVAALDAKDVYSRGHSERVSRLARAIAETLSLPPATIDQVELGGLMHDIGKIGIPDGILQKVSPLDDAERAVMMGHTELGAAILADSGSSALHDVIPLVRHHHEWFDGRGYPKGLVGEAIPLGAAII
ncbi:MAG: HD domain-containing protein, partial [Chloroflexota bacterium]|nr:HD domain-containing protein [Chloroflexota bacterium]